MPISDMEIFGIETKENQHTAFLSWFLDPEQNMGLGLEPLCSLLNLWEPKPEGGTPNPDGGWTPEMLEALTIEIETEPTESKGSRLDLLVTGKSENNLKNSFCLILEAKVCSEEHKNKQGQFQTIRYFDAAESKYQNWGNRIYYFLTLPKGEFSNKAKSEKFQQITFEKIVNIIQKFIGYKNNNPHARERLEQYLLCWANLPEQNNNGAMQILPNGRA